jgi:hypothetical protein
VAESPVTWLSVPEVAERLDVTPTKVRQFLEERFVLGSRRNGTLQIPLSLVEGGLLSELPGTITVLIDGGFSDDESLDWLLADNPALGVTPVAALREGRKKEVRRVAQSLAV